ncbi:gas vesicle protein [Actinomadura sp. WMMB 499]|uniref:gas vesicle protein GvpO n=1 Tax=Actinomadura sp. WMMB 499 TaxID=1219491 RepID=UPI00124817B0|nr:gas vesicle protein [Actinomadura sp. WMMB 499]QFG25202.1 gas vesicle protein [Actinomadura sp. WMMB 499]
MTNDRQDDGEAARTSASGSPRLTARDAIRGAAVQLAELLGAQPDSVSALQPRDEGGWVADVEVVEIERIPDTSSVMATYRVTLDPRGELVGYERTRRYARGQLDRT